MTLFSLLIKLIDWKTRFDAANGLAEIGKKSGDNLHKSKLQLKYFDYFTKLIQDSNIKVSNAAIGAFVDLIPTLKVDLFLINFLS